MKEDELRRFSEGFVSVDEESVKNGLGGYVCGFKHDGRYFCYHSFDPVNKGRVLYRDVTPD